MAGTEVLPTRLGRYLVRGKIGEGGMAAVLCGVATDAQGRQDAYALKMIREAFAMNQEFVAMFADEARTVASFDHPNIVRVHELGWEGNRLFMAMELLRGPSLWTTWNACRERGVRLRYELVALICAQVADALHYAHTHKDEHGRASLVVHRDVNPSNILLTYDGRVKVIDFGLAKAANRVSNSSRSGVVKGKLAYMSPEQASPAGNVDHRTDVYALGITLWELTTDRRLFKAESEAATLERVIRADIPDPMGLVEDYPKPLRDIVMRALAVRPQDRYASAGDMAQELFAYVKASNAGVGPAFLAGVLRSLFPGEEARLEAWVKNVASSPVMNAVTLRPGPAASERMAQPSIPPGSVQADALLLAEGRFAPSSRMMMAVAPPSSLSAAQAPPDSQPSDRAPSRARYALWAGAALLVAGCVTALGFFIGRLLHIR